MGCGGRRTKEGKGPAAGHLREPCPIGPLGVPRGPRNSSSGQQQRDLPGAPPAWIPAPPRPPEARSPFQQTPSSLGRWLPWGQAGQAQGPAAGAGPGRRGGTARPAAPPAPRAVRTRARAAAPAPCAWCPSPARGPPGSRGAGSPRPRTVTRAAATRATRCPVGAGRSHTVGGRGRDAGRGGAWPFSVSPLLSLLQAPSQECPTFSAFGGTVGAASTRSCLDAPPPPPASSTSRCPAPAAGPGATWKAGWTLCSGSSTGREGDPSGWHGVGCGVGTGICSSGS